MAGSLNSVMLIGNLGADPDIKTLQSGGKVANFSIATSDKWKDRNTGEQKERTEWHRVVCWNEALVNIIEQYTRKGSKIFVQGELQTRKWTDDSGVDRYSTEVVMTGFNSKLVLLNSQGGGISDPNGNSGRPGNQVPEDSGAGYGSGTPSGGGAGPMDDEDSIPF